MDLRIILLLTPLKCILALYSTDCSYQIGHPCSIDRKAHCELGYQTSDNLPSSPKNLTVRSINGFICANWQVQDDASIFVLEGFRIKAIPIHTQTRKVCHHIKLQVCQKAVGKPKTVMSRSSSGFKFLSSCFKIPVRDDFYVTVEALPLPVPHMSHEDGVLKTIFGHDGCKWADIIIEKNIIYLEIRHLGNINFEEYDYELFRCYTTHCENKTRRNSRYEMKNTQAIFRNVIEGIYLIKVTCQGPTCFICGDQPSREVYPIQIGSSNTTKFAVDKNNPNCEQPPSPASSHLDAIISSVCLVTVAIITAVIVLIWKCKKKRLAKKNNSNNTVSLLYSHECEEHTQCCEALAVFLKRVLECEIKCLSIQTHSQQDNSHFTNSVLSSKKIILIHSKATTANFKPRNGHSVGIPDNIFSLIGQHFQANSERFVNVRFSYSSEDVVPEWFRENVLVLLTDMFQLVSALGNNTNSNNLPDNWCEKYDEGKILKAKVATIENKFCRLSVDRNYNNTGESGYMTVPSEHRNMTSQLEEREALLSNQNDPNHPCSKLYRPFESVEPHMVQIPNKIICPTSRPIQDGEYEPTLYPQIVPMGFYPPSLDSLDDNSNISVSSQDLIERLLQVNELQPDDL